MKQKMVSLFIFQICLDVFLVHPIWKKHSKTPKKLYSFIFLAWKKMKKISPLPPLFHP